MRIDKLLEAAQTKQERLGVIRYMVELDHINSSEAKNKVFVHSFIVRAHFRKKPFRLRLVKTKTKTAKLLKFG